MKIIVDEAKVRFFTRYIKVEGLRDGNPYEVVVSHERMNTAEFTYTDNKTFDDCLTLEYFASLGYSVYLTMIAPHGELKKAYKQIRKVLEAD